MSKQKFITRSAGILQINAGRLGTPRSNPQIAPNNEPHADACGCVSCRITNRVDEAFDRHLGSEAAPVGDALAPGPGVLGNSQSKRSARGPLMPPRGVLAGGAR